MVFYEVLFTIFLAVGALFASVFYGLQSLVISLVPRKYRRKDVEGEIVLITGGGSGIGRLLSLKLAARGAKIISWDVNTSGKLLCIYF
ncbi:hypothetical protein Pmani_039224 [Petrolisthes manimaculis]|uniref:Uncharacterized protein n=1 Tax=Petrolisthes manimaculis TaxID=1843537 RepID=A0AAE1TLJ0_9EUCA|nr:hypothetical protein Pmani_039224 [Petrolisthes manimaculis]